MGRKLRVDFSNEQKSGDDDHTQVPSTLPSRLAIGMVDIEDWAN